MCHFSIGLIRILSLLFRHHSFDQSTRQKKGAVIFMITAPVCIRDDRLPAISLTAAGTATKSTTTATSARLLGTGFIHGERPTTHFRTIESGNGRLRFRIGSHLNEAEAA
jgi:hypothetical protein